MTARYPESASERLGPNHKDACDGKNWRFSGSGYNRVKLCACGAEDHAPEFVPSNAPHGAEEK